MMKKMLKKDIVKIGRIAGQYAKPRSSPTEVINGETISSYFGDNINNFKATKEGRVPDPERLIKGYHWAITTHHAIKKLIDNKTCDIAKEVLEEKLREQTNIDKDAPEYEDFISIIKDCAEDTTIMEDLFISHEGLLLDYESRLTKLSRSSKDVIERYYNCSTNFLWIGERTSKHNEAHVEYFRGIRNPVGIKIGPKSDPKEIVKSIKLLNPENELGKLTLILRLGAKNVTDTLPAIIEEVVKNKLNVVWVSDAVHGNTYINDCNFKVRQVDTILEELNLVYVILTKTEQVFGGIHIETSGENVTECLGGITRVTDDDLYTNYATY
jgi:3-deoxy-7-phosphoheptulonate synthase